jgi:mono/diheme cytochrome c family protein
LGRYPIKFPAIKKTEKEKKMNRRLAATIFLLTLFISACASPATPAPATATETLIVPTDTSIPATETSAPATEVPTATEPSTTSTGDVSFANDVLPIFQATCVKCHGGEDLKEGLDLTTYDGLIAGSFNGAVITAGNADDSYLVHQLLEGEMPKRGPRLADEQIQIIVDWINQGAINN